MGVRISYLSVRCCLEGCFLEIEGCIFGELRIENRFDKEKL